MLNVILKNHDFKYEVAELIKLFTSDFQFVENKSFGIRKYSFRVQQYFNINK